MKRLSGLIAGLLLGGAFVYGALNYHLVQTDDGYELIPKTAPTFADTWVDVRDFSLRDWYEHRDLAKAVIRADRQDLLGASAADDLVSGMSGLLDEFRQ